MLKTRGKKKQWTMMKNSGKIRTHDDKIEEKTMKNDEQKRKKQETMMKKKWK